MGRKKEFGKISEWRLIFLRVILDYRATESGLVKLVRDRDIEHGWHGSLQANYRVTELASSEYENVPRMLGVRTH